MNAPRAHRLCVVTGATGGIGAAIAQGLAAAGNDVVVIGRNEVRGHRISLQLAQRYGVDVRFESADLSAQASVRGLVSRLRAGADRIDVLVNCASGVFDDRRVSIDGVEYTLALNHLGPLLLTLLLEPLLMAAPQARVITVAADPKMLAAQPPDPEDLEMKKHYSGIKAYMRSKNLNVMTSYELGRRWEGGRVTASAYHLGVVRTALAANLGPFKRLVVQLANPFLLTPEQGADTGVWLATNPNVSPASGGFFVRRQGVKSARCTYDRALSARVWQQSMNRLDGVAVAA